MKIKIDENNYITAYAVIGDVEDSIDINAEENIFNDNPCFLYKYENGSIALDENKKAEYLKEQEKLNKIESIQLQIDEVSMWLNNYDEKYKEYERCQRFGLEFEGDIDVLNSQASEKQSMLIDLKNQLKNLK
ncbi:DUF2977 domain-containing protein [uncultured Anaerofustis sp.]|uniref:DUF2977 domain-containing protein n=1 Tax=uncultured Anaerofustis sp. TaxID=904996 RepID=UPI0025FEF88E|nr:DUF2977 domain-containing protein [uncultured Anaerofustis sp.]